MTGRPDSFMPLWIGDYLADTSHLSAAEHGAYLLMLMHYWRSGPLPDAEDVLMRIARMSRAEWKSSRLTLREFFDEAIINNERVLTHTRVERELVEASTRYNNRKTASDAGVAARNAKRNVQPSVQPNVEPMVEPNVRPLVNQSQSQTSNEVVPLAKANGRSAQPKDDPWSEVYAKGREIFGEQGGHIVTKLKAIYPKPNKVLATLLQAKDAINPTEYVFKILHEKSKPGTHLATGMFP